MKNFFLLFIACLFLFGCATRVSYWQHYQNCAVVEKTMKGISDCGKQSRMNYINESIGKMHVVEVSMKALIKIHDSID